MKKNILLFICCFLLSSLNSQTLISGFVKDESGHPVRGALIWQGNSQSHTSTDYNGAFHLVYDSTLVSNIHFDKPQYLPLVIEYKEGTVSPMQVVMILDKEEIITHDYSHRWKERGGLISANIDIVDEDFDQFESLLGKENVETLNRVAGIFNAELGFTRDRFYFGFPIGFIFTTNNDPDSIDIELTNSIFGINIGHRLIDNKRFYFMPNASIKWYKYRLINSSVDEDLNLQNYLETPDLDLRIWQPTGFIGGTLAFKFKGKKFKEGAYWTLGAYGGYIFKLSKSPNIRGARSFLNVKEKIDLKPFNLGLFVSANFD